MKLNSLMNSPSMWLVCSFIIVTVLSLSTYYMIIGLKRANEIGITRDRYTSALRSAAITCVGPSLSPIIVLISVIAIVGGPTAWMRLNSVGAARTELAMITMSSGLLGIEPGAADFGVRAFSYSIWGMALNDMGWFIVAFLLTKRMGQAVDYLSNRYDSRWISLLMTGATFGVTGYLLGNQIISKMLVTDVSLLFRLKGLIPAIISATVLSIIHKFFSDKQRLQELALGIAMVVGMFSAQLIFS